ncbi:MAG: hypothetical protein R3C03_01045 [Pirellulaceae bacterium]
MSTSNVFGFARLAPAIVAISCLLGSAAAFGQAESPNVTRGASIRESVEDPEFSLYDYATNKEFDIDFQGGTLAEYIELINKVLPEMTIIVSPEVREIQLPSIRLRRIDGEGFIRSIELLSVEAAFGELDPDYQSFYIVRKNPEHLAGVMEVFNVKDIIGDDDERATNTQVLLDAIREGTSMLSASSGSLKISLHDETGLLFVKGNREEVSLVSQIIEKMY